MERQASADVGALVDISTVVWAGLYGGKIGALIFFTFSSLTDHSRMLTQNYFYFLHFDIGSITWISKSNLKFKNQMQSSINVCCCRLL